MEQSLGIPILVVLVGALVGALTDVWQFKVHNLLTFPLLLSGLLYHGILEGMPGVTASLLGALFGFGTLLILYVLGGMGAGDVKFVAAVGAWLGFPVTLVILLAAFIAAGIYAIALLVLFGNLRETWVNVQIACHRVLAFGRYLGAEDRAEIEVQRGDRRRRLIPFTAMVALGIVAVVVVACWTHPVP